MERPRFVTFLAVLDLLSVPFYVLFGLYFVINEETVITIVLLLVAVLQLTAAWGLLKLRRFGHAAQSTLGWLGLLLVPFGTVSSVLILFYLYQKPVRLLFRAPDGLTADESASVSVLRQKKLGGKAAAVLVLSIATVVFAGSMIIPGLIGSPSRSQLKRTMADIRSLGVAVESYAVENKCYPVASSPEQLAAVLQPDYITQLPLKDAWGNPFRYAAWQEKPDSGGADCCMIASAGKDGEWEVSDPRLYVRGETKTLEADLVWRSGEFVRYPASEAR